MTYNDNELNPNVQNIKMNMETDRQANIKYAQSGLVGGENFNHIP